MSCRACFSKVLEKENLCDDCKTSLREEQVQALCEDETVFKLLKIEDQKGKRVKLTNAIPTAKKTLFFEVISGDIIVHLLKVLDEFLPKDLIDLIHSYFCEFYRICLEYTSNYEYYYGDWCYSHTLNWTWEGHRIRLNYQHADNGDIASLYWECVNVESDVFEPIELSDWGPKINLVPLMPKCSHSVFLEALSRLFLCIPRSAWDYRRCD